MKAAHLPALACIALAAPLHAAPADGRVVYDAAYYTQFAPRTALDMINQTPGFSLAEGTERRGFSGALGNVLIDGERPSAKSQSLGDILQRIPAAQVVRIELLRGGEAGGDTGAFALLANVVRTHSAGQGVWELGTEYAGRLPAPNGWASWTGRIGKTDYSLGANGYSLLRRLPGDRLLLDGDGMVTGSRTDRSPRSFYEISVNAEASRAMFGGRTRVTGQAYRSRYHERSRIHTFSRAGDPVEDELNPYTESKRSWEGGFSHDRAVGRWDLTLAGLLTRTRFQSDVSSTHARPVIGIDAIFAQALARNSGESILRASLGGAVGPRHRVEAGAEAAINSLGQKLALSLDVGGGPFPIPVPNSNLEVKERRGEVYLVDRWTLSRRWSMEARLAAELSRLSFSGDTQDSVSLAYLKPSLQVTRGLGARDQLRLRLHRDVGQLDFTNFVSAASLSDDIIKGGNPALRPETSWRLEGVADLRFGRDGAATITLFRHWISDVVDLVPVGEPGAVVDAPGNIGRGEVKGVQLNLRLPVAPFIRGGALTLDGTWRRSRVTDPLTGRRRPITGFEPLLLKAEFRQDLPARKLAWGLKYTGKSTRIFFRLNETDRRRDSPSLDLWAETTALSGFKLRATFVGLLDQPELRERSFFAPDRNGERVGIERSKRRPGAWLQLAVSGSF